jgi:hypothetical protein
MWNFNLRPRLGIAMLCVCLVGSVVAASADAANAPRWQIELASLGNGKTEPFQGKSTEMMRLNVPGLAAAFLSPSGQCTWQGKIEGSLAGVPGRVKETQLTCTGASVEGDPNCVIRSPGEAAGVVKTNLLIGTLVWTAAEEGPAGVILSPEAIGGSIGEIEVGGLGCKLLAGKYPVENKVIGLITPVNEERWLVTEGFPVPPVLKWWNNNTPMKEETITQLAVAKQNATFRCSFTIFLNPLKTFKVFPG